MKRDVITQHGVPVAVVSSSELLICDTQSTLDLAMTIHYQIGCHRIALRKEHFAEDFLSSPPA